MAKNTLIGINAVAHKANKIYVGVDGTARKVKKGYVGIDGVAHLFLSGDPVVIYESAEAGTQMLVLTPGTYEITLIGGGGGAAGRRSGVGGNHFYAMGGVGATLQFIAKLATNATIQVTVGAGGATKNGTFSDASAGTLAGIVGGASLITGFPNLTAQANGGNPGSLTATSSTNCTMAAGTIGSNILSGSAVTAININNPNQCESRTGTGAATSTQRRTSGRTNDNWAEDTTRGRSGDSGWVNKTNFIALAGAAGFVRIKML